MTNQIIRSRAAGLLTVLMVCGFPVRIHHAAQNSGTLSSPSMQTQQSSTKADWQLATLNEIKSRIAGKEDEPAETVFKNIEILKGKKASRLPGMMQALTGLLGVDCTYCHVKDQWDKEDKPAKQVTRKHFQMQAQMNNEYFGGSNAVTCWTCHRGQPKPQDDTKK